MTTAPALDGALQTAHLGPRVFPVWGVAQAEGKALVPLQCACPQGESCDSPCKHPIPKNWQGVATTDAGQIHAWATRHPNCNWGMRTDDLVVIDVDPRSGGSEGALPTPVRDSAWHVTTGGGGVHIGHRVDPVTGVAPKGGNGALGPGLDLKGKGGFVVCAGSTHVSGGVYQWTNGPPASLDWVTPWVDPRGNGTRNAGPAAPGHATTTLPIVNDIALALASPHKDPERTTLIGLLSNPPIEGSRNNWLTSVAGHIYKHFPFADGAEALVRTINQNLGQPLSEDEVKKVLHSVVGTDDDLRDARFAEAVAKRAWTLRVAEEAQREVRSSAWREPPLTQAGDQYLAVEDEDEPWSIVDLLGAGGNALLAAQFKVGKTTLLLNLMKAMTDRKPFLGRFPAPLEPNARVGFWNYEMSQVQFRRWVRKMGINQADRFAVADLRGFDVRLGTDEGDRWAIEWLKRWEVQAWIVDPYARAYSGESENDNTEVARFTDAVDRVKEQAGVDIAVLGAHFGRQQFEGGMEHVRGATRLDDWADSRWIQTKDLDGDRFFSAIGRDVEVDEARLSFNKASLALTLIQGGRGERALTRVEDAIWQYIRTAVDQFSLDQDLLKRAVSGRSIESAVEGKGTAIRAALRKLDSRGTLRAIPGPGNTVWHVPADYPWVDE